MKFETSGVIIFTACIVDTCSINHSPEVICGTSSDYYNLSGICVEGCGISCNDDFYYGSGYQVQLNIVPQSLPGVSGVTYSASAGTLEGTTNPYRLTMPDADVVITANFTYLDYSITIADASVGYLTAPLTAYCGETVTITVSDDSHNPCYGVGNITVTKVSDGTTIPVSGNTFTMPAGNVVISCELVKQDITYLNEEGETATVSASDYTVLTFGTTTLNAGWYVVAEDLEFSARLKVVGNVKLIVEDGESAEAPNPPVHDGYIFVGWNEDFSSVTDDMTVYAIYSQRMIGDINADGQRNSFDALIILRCSLQLIDFSENDIAWADMNGDGSVTSFDALIVLRIALGLLPAPESQKNYLRPCRPE